MAFRRNWNNPPYNHRGYEGTLDPRTFQENSYRRDPRAQHHWGNPSWQPHNNSSWNTPNGYEDNDWTQRNRDPEPAHLRDLMGIAENQRRQVEEWCERINAFRDEIERKLRHAKESVKLGSPRQTKELLVDIDSRVRDWEKRFRS